MSDTPAAPAPAPAPGGDVPAEGAPAVAAPPAPKKYRLKGIDGDGEQEYEEGHLIGLAKRGKNAAQMVSLAEKRAQEALKREKDTEAKLARLKDPKQARAVLKELGVDVRGLSTEEILEAVEEEKLTPEQRRIRDLERKEADRLKADEDTKKKEVDAKTDAEVQQHLDELSNTFQDVMALTGLPRESAVAVGYRLAAIYQAADAAGVEVDPEVAADRVKAALKGEQAACFKTKDGKWDVPALAEWIGPEGMDQIRKQAVKDYLSKRNGGGAQPAQQAAPPAPVPRHNTTANGKPAMGSSEWWRRAQQGDIP